jgi:hypothetical protein
MWTQRAAQCAQPGSTAWLDQLPGPPAAAVGVLGAPAVRASPCAKKAPPKREAKRASLALTARVRACAQPRPHQAAGGAVRAPSPAARRCAGRLAPDSRATHASHAAPAAPPERWDISIRQPRARSARCRPPGAGLLAARVFWLAGGGSSGWLGARLHQLVRSARWLRALEQRGCTDTCAAGEPAPRRGAQWLHHPAQSVCLSG